MKREQYQTIHEFVLARPGLERVVQVSTRVLPGLVYVSYPLLLLYLLVTQSPGLLRAIWVPVAGFLAVTALRAGINAPRPYERLDIPAITRKDTVGKSFPSRHGACAAVIAVTAFHEIPVLGVLLMAVSGLIAVSRVLAGVHFVKDVVCGLLLGGLIGWVGMYWIP